MNNDSNRVFRKSSVASFTRFGDDMLIAVPRTKAQPDAWQIVLNGVGARLYELLDGKRTLADLAEVVGREFAGATPDQIMADTLEILADLESKGAVQDVTAG